MTSWEFVKHRTATNGGAVYRSADGALFKRTGGRDVHDEAVLQQRLAALGYPVPAQAETGRTEDGGYFFTEHTAGPASLHDLALDDTRQHGTVTDNTLATAADVSTQLLAAQTRHATPATTPALRQWFARASFADNVFTENPNLDTSRVRNLVDRALGRLRALPMCESHLDYGMPNAFPGGVIDWQHHALAPLGYDVYPMLDIAAFKGGNRGYTFTPTQRAHYQAALDARATPPPGAGPLSTYLGEFLLTKCFFFLALMRPTDPDARPDKHTKWQYRRALFREGVNQYEQTGTIDTGTFPTLADFTQRTARERADRS